MIAVEAKKPSKKPSKKLLRYKLLYFETHENAAGTVFCIDIEPNSSLMPDAPIVVADSETLRSTVADVIRDVMIDAVPDALEEAQKSKWLHRDEAKDQFGLTDRQLQYLRDENRVTYTQHGRRIWYLRESLERYFDEGRVDARSQ